MTESSRPPRHATHERWDFCARVFTEVWDGIAEHPPKTVVNIHPFAGQLQRWLRQEPAELALITPGARTISNRYAHHASFLVAIFTEVVNDFHAFLRERSPSFVRAYEVDVRRMRFVSEMILYAVRIFEALLKQLLYCTQFDIRRYEKAALGQLLSSRCEACWREKKVVHKVSLAGSLAHRYGLCGQYEQCLRKDLQALNHLRNAQAAHATVGAVAISPSLDSAWTTGWEHLTWIGEKVTHMLGHVAELEVAMIAEAKSRLRSEIPTGRHNSNLVSTYYWQIELVRLYSLLQERSRKLKGTAGVSRS